MTKQNKNTQKLAKLLQSTQKDSPEQATLLAELATQIAQDDEAIQQLVEISAAIQEEGSSLQQDIEQIRELDLWLERIGAYVEAERNGLAAAELYPEVAERIAVSELYRNEYESLRLAMADTTLSANAPTHLNFKQWRSQTQEDSNALSASMIAEQIWRQLENGLYQLIGEIPVRLRNTAATFGTLPAGLSLQTAPAAMFRNNTNEQPDEVAWLELPLANGVYTVGVYVGPVRNQMLTLIIDVKESTSKHSVRAIEVELYTVDGDLLESTSTDEKGRVVFEQLATDTYQMRIDNTYAFTVNMEAV